MDLDAMITAAVDTLKQHLRDACKEFDAEALTPALAEQVTEGLKQALAAAGVAALQTFLTGYETDALTIRVNETVYRFKQPSPKTFLTPFGPMRLARRLYQADAGGPAYVPLDALWGMAGEFATVEVREVVLFACAQITPEETAALLQKSALCPPSATAIKHIVAETGDWLEAEGEALNQTIRQPERVPEATRVLVASLDGVTIRMAEPGAKRGPAPTRPTLGSGVTPTASQQAWVGSVSCYAGAGPEQAGPQRLGSRYVAQMPEANGTRLKRRFEDELTHSEPQLADGVIKLLVIDGARGLWQYVTDTPRFADYELLIDFYQTTEHLSLAAELLLSKAPDKAKRWYQTYYDTLLNKDGAAEAIIRSIDSSRTRGTWPATRAKALMRERTFFERNKTRMTSADFLRRGLPIGSGPVEAACKTLVKTRLGRSGMYWSWKGGQRILQLRPSVKSDRWDAFWQQDKARRIEPMEHQVLAHAA